jgi:hypothetical protein
MMGEEWEMQLKDSLMPAGLTFTFQKAKGSLSVRLFGPGCVISLLNSQCLGSLTIERINGPMYDAHTML